ncbi:MAG: RNA-binding protein [candidate division Zixibacteria bacterium]|nr:RNA-binding protein [candidate division Zixibacteria bacterium]
MNIYVGNLSHDATEQELMDAFAAFGEVKYAKIIKDRETGQPRGFGFVEMSDETQANAAIAEMNGKPFKGRNLKVNVGRPKEERAGFGSDRRGGFGSPRREPR